MIELVFWLLLSQTFTNLPEMAVGTEVRIYSNDLFTVFAAGVVDNGTLTLKGRLEPGKEVRVLILTHSMVFDEVEEEEEEEDAALAAAKALYGRISRDGKDIYLRIESVKESVSFGQWLLEERDIVLKIGSNDAPQAGDDQ